MARSNRKGPEPRGLFDGAAQLQAEKVVSSRAGRSDEDRARPYRGFYQALAALREEFHRIGRFDDANAKLEEVCKLLAVAALDRRHPAASGESKLSAANITAVACRKFGSASRLAGALHTIYADFARRFPEELASFGGKPGLSLAEDDDEFAAALVPLLSSLPAEPDGSWSFDGLNEAFGHFVQASFRNRKEDAQYMTPPEVVAPLVRLAIEDVVRDLGSELGLRRPLRVADPTCGVGSFLAAAYRASSGVETKAGPLSQFLVLLGQDKVDRMVRMANANLRIFARTTAQIRGGNSILPPEGLRDWAGSVDLILTNPPFGAEFDIAQILSSSTADDFPAFHSLAKQRRPLGTVGSEYLLVDRGVSLLRPGGRMLIVVPDHVVSGSGFSEDFRGRLREFADLEAVFDLPAETFAQAGTRTRTSVLYLRRKSSNKGSGKHFVVMATADDLGFRVKSRTGATVKEIVGANEMETIADVVSAFRKKSKPAAGVQCLSDAPSVIAVVDSEVQADHWNAGFFRARRLMAQQLLCDLERRGMQLKGLGDVAEVDPPSSARATAENGYTCISVLHVREDGVIDMDAALRYRPATPCVPCLPGDVLMSRINPHIVRVCVVPEVAGLRFACSAEFAIMRPRAGAGLAAPALALLLRSEVVQAQVQTLTSGTSSSHSRVKPRELARIRVAVPKAGSKDRSALEGAAQSYESAIKQLYQAAKGMADAEERVAALLGLRAET